MTVYLPVSPVLEMYVLGGAQRQSDNGSVFASLVDCAGNHVLGTINVSPAGSILYADSNALPTLNFSTTTSNSIAYVF